MAARLSIMRAARQLAVEANVHIHVRNFSVINQVGAASIDARLDCDAFASTHSATSHYDRASFVGLAWRPENESICCEIYATGRANLPGSTRERDMLGSFSRMLPELLRHSDRKDVFEKLPEHLKAAHRPRDVERDDAPAATHAHAAPRSTKKRAAPSRGLNELWGGDGLIEAAGVDLPPLMGDCDDDEALLASAGF
jgi:hypothetical protein